MNLGSQGRTTSLSSRCVILSIRRLRLPHTHPDHNRGIGVVVAKILCMAPMVEIVFLDLDSVHFTVADRTYVRLWKLHGISEGVTNTCRTKAIATEQSMPGTDP